MGVSGRYRISEAMAVVGIALALFAVVLVFLRIIFPSGSGLRVGEARLAAGTRSTAAVLVRMTNTVKHRPVDALFWSEGRQGERLREGDAVQTFDESTARIQFSEGNLLDMGPNSLVVVKRAEQDPVRSEVPSELVMVDGELRGTVGARDGAMVLDVALPGGMVKIRPGTRGRTDAQFKITATARRGSTVAVYRGVAELNANGRTLQVVPNFASTIGPDGAVAEPVPLPARPVLVEPVKGRTYHVGDRREKIRFSWTGSASVDEFHIIIARDSSFDHVVYDARVATPELRYGNLEGGTYYWRVSSIAGGLEGAYSDPERLKVIQVHKEDHTPPALEVDVLQKARGAHVVTLTGRTEPGARVFAGDRRIPVTPTGSFRFTVDLYSGSNIVVVRAEDQAGNVAYRSELVRAEF